MSSEQIGELLDDLQKRVDRCKVMFEQYFLGIQKTPPHQMQIDLERKIRKLTQTHISNTGLRFRFTTLSQKFASYNTYWKRTMRQIENGSYIRDIAKLGRDAVRLGKDVPDELLAKMPKRMRERIVRDRAVASQRALKIEARETKLRESGKVRDHRPGNVHTLDGDDLDNMDLDSIFNEMQSPTSGSSDADIDQLFDDITNQDQPAPLPPRASQVNAPQMNAPRPQSANAAAASRPSSPPPVPRRAPPSRTSKAPPIPRASPRESPRASRSQKAQAQSVASPAVGRPSAPPPGMSVKEAQALYKSYKKARELVGQDTSKLNYDRLMRSLNKQAPTILKQYNAKAVKFDVVVQGDQVILKAKPEK